jgi:hypothetical protein
MAKTAQDATMYRGNRKVLRYTVTDEDNSGAALDITSYTIRWAATRTNASGNPIETGAVIDLNSTSDPTQVVKTTPASGIVDITLLEADTTSLTPGSYYIELEGVDGSGNSEVFAVGTLTLEPNIDNA